MTKTNIPIEVGKKYQVRHSRKGTFSVKITAINGEWITGEIIAGRAEALMEYNEKETGEEITMRDTHCTFTPLP